MAATLPTATTPFVSITSYGAVGDGVTNNQAAIQAAFNYAAAHGDAVYIPAGTFAYSGVINANGIAVFGGGTASILKPTNVTNEALELTGSGGSISNLSMVSSATARLTSYQAAMIWVNGATNFTVDHVTITGSSDVGIFNSGGQNGLIQYNTVQNTLADAITNTDGASHVTVLGNLVKNAHDDGISNNSYTNNATTVNNILVQGNTILNNLSGRGLEVSGGSNITFTGNYVDNPDGYSDMYIASEAEWSTQSVSNITVSGNSFVNGGPNQGSVIVYNSMAGSNTISGVTITGNQFVNPKMAALQVTGAGTETGIVVQNNIDYSTNGFSNINNKTASVSLTNNQVLSPSSYTTPLVSPGNGAGTTSTPVPTTPTPTPTPASPNNTTVLAGSSAAIVDSAGNKWTITSSGQIAVNGVVDTITSSVTELAYVNAVVWQENSSNLWWSKTSPTASWSPTGGTAMSPLTVAASPNDTVVHAGSASAITDSSGNKWTITSGGQVAVNGVVDPVTSSVTELAYVNAVVWQENSSNLWWGKANPTASWSPTAGLQTSPLAPDTLTLNMSETAYSGDANFVVRVNGTQVGGTMTTHANHSTGESDVFQLTGQWGSGIQKVQIQFVNPTTTGAVSQQRNLYVNSIAYDGKTDANTTASLLSGGTTTATFSVGGNTATVAAPADRVTLSLSEDAYQGDAQFTITLDGKSITTAQSVTSLHSAGAWEQFQLSGNFGNGSHALSIKFAQDAYGGSALLDRNLYSNGISVNGQHYGGLAALNVTGATANYTFITDK